MVDIRSFLPLVSREHPSQLVVAVAQVGNQLYLGWNSFRHGSKKARTILPDGTVFDSRHAEDHVLSRIPRTTNPKRVTVWVARFLKSGGLGMARPCLRCQMRLAIRGVSPKRVYYTDDNGGWKRLGAWDMDPVKRRGVICRPKSAQPK